MTQILIVDDQEQDLHMLQVLLQGHGYEVRSARNGIEALNTARCEAPDLIVTDTLMPGMDGFSLCREWMTDERLRHVPLVFYTATYTDPQDEAFALSLGAARFIAKPSEPDAFVDILRQVLESPAAPRPVPLGVPSQAAESYYQHCDQTLIRKLENKIVQLEEANRALKLDIVARQRVEEALRESEEKFRTHKRAEADLRVLASRQEALLAAVPDIIMEVDNDKVYTWANQAGFEFFGQDVIGKEAAFYFEGEQDAYAVVQPLFDGGENTIYLESWQRRKDGQRRLLAWWCRVLKDDGGNVTGALSSARDITERKQAEDALRESQAALLKAQRVAHVGSWVWHIPSNRLEWSDEMYRIFGIERKSFAGDLSEVIAHAIHPDDRAAVDKSNPFVIDDRQPIPQEYRVIWPDGTVRVVRAEAGELNLDGVGNPAVFTGFVQDITERKQAEEALRSAKEELERQNARLHALYRAGQAVNSTLNGGAILDHLVGEAMHLTRATHGQVLIAREDLGCFERRSLHGFSADEAKLAWTVPLHLDQGINGQAYTTRQTVCVQDVTTLPGYFPLISTTRSEMAVPIVREGRALGNLDLQSPELDGFRDVDLDYLAALADQVSIALENARLYAEARHRNRELALLNWVITASAESQTIEPILETVCRELALMLGLPNASAALLNETKTEVVVVTEYRPEDWPSLLGVTIPLPEGLRVTYLEHTAPLVVVDAQTDALLAPIRDLFRRRGTVSVLILPLLIEGEVAGSLLLGAAERRLFAAEEVDLARRVAEQVGGALARARLEETRQRLSTAVEQAADSILITDTQGAMLYVNPAFERITGYSSAEVIGQNPRLLKSGKHDAAFYEELWRTISGGKVWRGRLVNRKKDGSLFTEDAVITPVRNQAGEIVSYVATRRDVTREVELEEQFRQAQKMEAVGRLAGGVAHDFNNLLTVIHLSVRLLERRLQPEDSLWPHVQRIRETGERATRLARQLLAFSRQEAIEPRVLNLNDVVGDTSTMLQQIIGEDVELSTRPAGGLWPVYADSAQIEQVILNLAVNARDAMPQGGTLTIETANAVLDEAYTHRHLDVEPGEYVMLSVSDTGTGMDDEVKRRLFEPFFTTKEKGKGTGLGLATVFGIVKQNGGHVWVYSEVAQGTTFKVYLPRTEEVESRPLLRPRLPVADSPARGAETLLVVEDDADVRELVAQILSTQGYQLLIAANGSEATRISEEHSSPIQLLLTDLVMPHMSGKELADRLGSRRPEMRVLYMSGYADAVLQRRVLAGQSAFLSKPFTVQQLIQKVQAVLSGPHLDPGQPPDVQASDK